MTEKTRVDTLRILYRMRKTGKGLPSYIDRRKLDKRIKELEKMKS